MNLIIIIYRECYYLGNKRCIEEVFEDRSILKIIKKKFTIALDTNEVIEDGRSEEEFFYDQNNNLVHYIENNWNFKGIKSKFSKDVRFYYYVINNMIRKMKNTLAVVVHLFGIQKN